MPRRTWQVELGAQIRRERTQSRLSQAELGKLVDKSRGSINSYENGTGNPEFRVVARIACVLNASFDVLGCRIAAEARLSVPDQPSADQLILDFDRDHSFLATVKIRPSKQSITITTHADYGIKAVS
jgi:transcriptional regulator with XRE-family HTH domain